MKLLLPCLISIELVFVVRVGCIIEAHPSPNDSNGRKASYNYQHHVFTTTELETAASHFALSSPKNGLGSISKKPSSSSTSLVSPISNSGTAPISSQNIAETSTTTPTFSSAVSTIAARKTSRDSQFQGEATTIDVGNAKHKNQHGEDDDTDEDNCSGKTDGYYQNYGSGCSSYYFCAAGYQITYVCQNGQKFNGKKCEQDYACPTDGHVNDCKDKSNGYYSNRKNLGKYFYCFQQAKVIELQCEPGKVFLAGKCTHLGDAAPMVTDSKDGMTCSKKLNGFYQDLRSNCESYYYCIGGEKRELKCQQEYIFNGDICVHRSTYQCPNNRPPLAYIAGTGSQTAEKKAKSGDQRRGGRETTGKGKLPIIV